jgi:hypothetical protein
MPGLAQIRLLSSREALACLALLLECTLNICCSRWGVEGQRVPTPA